MEATTWKNMRLILPSETGNVAYDMFHMGIRIEIVVHVVPDTPFPPLPTVTCCYNLEKQLMGFYYSPATEMCWKYLSIPMVPAVLLPQGTMPIKVQGNYSQYQPHSALPSVSTSLGGICQISVMIHPHCILLRHCIRKTGGGPHTS